MPERAEMGLSDAKQIADKVGVTIPMASTAITDVTSPHAESILASCTHYGIKTVKLGYWRYQPFGSLAKQLDEARRKLERVAKLARRYHVLPCVHVHSGDTLTNGGAFLYMVLKDFAPDEVGAYVDPMHMTLEGGSFGWEMGLDLVAPWIALVGLKNFRWLEDKRDRFGQMRYRWQYTPLSEGQAPLPQFFQRLKQLNYDGTVSLHSEYKGRTSFKKLTSTELLKQSEIDLKYIKKVIAAL